MQRMAFENKQLKSRIKKLENLCYPLRAAATQIQTPLSPQFSMDSPPIKQEPGTERNTAHYRNPYHH